jgi:hypothetical protein
MRDHDTGRLKLPSNAGFSQIQNGFLRDSGLSQDARTIGSIYATFANYEGSAWPGLDTLEEISGICRDRVKKAKKELRQRGLIQKQQQRRAGGQFGEVRYRVGPGILVPKKPGDIAVSQFNRSTEFQYSGGHPRKQ